MEIERDQLDALLGRQVVYRDRTLQVVEILPEEPALVLAECRGSATVQADQLGSAPHCRPQSWTVPVFNPEGSDFHPLVKELRLL